MVTPDTDSHRSAGSGTDQTPIRPPGTLRWIPLIMLGGCLGTAARAGLETRFPPTLAALPWTTLTINLIGSFVLGVLLEALSAAGPDRGARRAMRLTLGTGILGGFTTYSTFMVETAERLGSGHALLAIAYLVCGVILGLLAAALGISTASRMHRARREGRGT
jgi:fluoride exporter